MCVSAPLSHLYELQDAVCRVMTLILMDAGLVEDDCRWICMNVVLKKKEDAGEPAVITSTILW